MLCRWVAISRNIMIRELLPLTGALKGCLTPDGLRPVNNGEEIAEGATIFNVG